MEEADSFAYSFVARGTVVLAQHTVVAGDFPAIAAECLQRLPASNNKFTYNNHLYDYNFLIQDGYSYCAVTKESSAGKQIANAFLERIKDDFVRRFKGGKADTAIANSLNKEFGFVMKENMKYVMDHKNQIEKLAQVEAQVLDVKNLMLKNIETTIERGQNLDELNDKAGDLHNSALEYEKGATQMRRKMWVQNMKMKLIILGIIVVLVLIIWLSICGGFNCSN